ncbi:hypothetical protein [Kitasatospora camelliae]|uniref:Integral membrane protein n=1 Tax=Kitasatospora camelliae TaxID=3156397 RepID=A0AAU8JUA0_9ACTN
MDTRQDELRRDLDAAVQTRKELGKEYESEIIDSFLARLDERMAARGAGRPSPAPFGPPGHPHEHAQRGRGRGFVIQILSLVMGVPLSAIAVEGAGPLGLVVCWAGIVGINVSSAVAERKAERRRSGWD